MTDFVELKDQNRSGAEVHVNMEQVCFAECISTPNADSNKPPHAMVVLHIVGAKAGVLITREDWDGIWS